jgi:hypothetical protein
MRLKNTHARASFACSLPRVFTRSLSLGILDKTEGVIDTDNDNVPDRLDLDSDNDCLGDRIEGVPNWRFANPTACASESPIAPLDTDGDGLSLARSLVHYHARWD